MHESEKWKWSRSVMSDSSQPHGLQPSRLLCPWDFSGKSTGVGCHHLLCCHYIDTVKLRTRETRQFYHRQAVVDRGRFYTWVFESQALFFTIQACLFFYFCPHVPELWLRTFVQSRELPLMDFEVTQDKALRVISDWFESTWIPTIFTFPLFYNMLKILPAIKEIWGFSH